MCWHRLLGGAALFALSLSSPAVGQPQANQVVGAWRLSVADSDFGLTPAPDSARLVIRQANEHLDMREDYFFPHPHGHMYADYDMPIDGEEYFSTTHAGIQAMRVAWEGSELLFSYSVDSGAGLLDVTEKWSVTGREGRHQLVVVRSIFVPSMQEIVSNRLVFDRRDDPSVNPTEVRLQEP